MIAIGFFLLCVVALMMWLDRPIFGDEAPVWYATIGVISGLSGILSIAAGFAMILWRVAP
jgi:hypothetical protein